MKFSIELRRRSRGACRYATAVTLALALTACETGPDIAGTDPLHPGTPSGSEKKAEESTANSGDAGAEVFALLLGGVATAGLIAAGASGEAGQQAIAAAAASATDPAAAGILGAIQTGTAPAAAANGTALTQQAAYSSGGGGSCDEALRQVDQQLANASSNIRNEIERMEATMWALMTQRQIMWDQCPNAEPYTSMIQQHSASFDATARACDAHATKGKCVAQLPTGQPSEASQAYLAAQSSPEQSYGSSDTDRDEGGCRSVPGVSVCAVK